MNFTREYLTFRGFHYLTTGHGFVTHSCQPWLSGRWVGLGLGGLGLRTGVSVTETGNWLLGRQTSDGQEAARCFYQLLPRTGCQSCGSLVRRGRQKQDNPDRDKLGQNYTIVQFKSCTFLKGKQNQIVADILLCTVGSIVSMIIDVDERELSWKYIFLK